MAVLTLFGSLTLLSKEVGFNIPHRLNCGSCEGNLTEIHDGFNHSFQPLMVESDEEQAPIVEVLVLYTEQALRTIGTIQEMEALIDEQEVFMNRALTNSDVDLRFRIIHKRMIRYEESGVPRTDLDRMMDRSDGFLPEVHDLRDQFQADLVSLIVSDLRGLAGAAQFPDGPNTGFMVADARETRFDPFLFTHEWGHNLGCRHQKPTTAGPYPFGYGLSFQAQGASFRTVMSVGPGVTLPYFSNPDIEFFGTRTGNRLVNNAEVCRLGGRVVANYFTPLSRIGFESDHLKTLNDGGDMIVRLKREGDLQQEAQVGIEVDEAFKERINLSNNVVVFGVGESQAEVIVSFQEKPVEIGMDHVFLTLHSLTYGVGLSQHWKVQISFPADRPGIRFTNDRIYVQEGQESLPIELIVEGSREKAFTFDLTTQPGDAELLSDFDPLDETFSVVSGQELKLIHLNLLNDDQRPELDERFFIEIRNQSEGIEVLSPSRLEVVMVDDDREGSVVLNHFPPIAITPWAPMGAIVGLEASVKGQLLVGGGFRFFSELDSFGLASVDYQGHIDKSFSDIPFLTTPELVEGSDGAFVIPMELADGSVIAHGMFNWVDGQARSQMVKLTPEGKLDEQFGKSTSINSSVRRVIVDSKGRLLAGGRFKEVNGIMMNNVARFNADGTLDRTFRNPVAGAYWINTILEQPDGKIIVGGSFWWMGGSDAPNIARLLPNGSRDRTFSVKGERDGAIREIIGLDDGSLIIGGDFPSIAGEARPYMARLLHDGSLSDAFMVQGGPDGPVRRILRLPDDKLLVCGLFNTVDGVLSPGIVRLFPDGSMDPSFVSGLSPGDSVYSFELLPNGKLFVGGLFHHINASKTMHLAQLFMSPVHPSLHPISLSEEKTITLTLSGLAGFEYVIQCSDDLESWKNWRTVRLDGRDMVIKSQTTGESRQFFRVVYLDPVE